MEINYRNIKYYHITTHNNYKFNLIKEINEDIIILKNFIKDNNNDDICLQIRISTDNKFNTADIIVFYYNRNCSINEIKSSHINGIIEMMKTALQVVYNNYPYITRFTLEDETHYNNIELNKPHITAKRLLIGTPGWYQQHFGAEPEKTTVELIEYIKIKRIEINNVIRKITPQNSGEEWWTTENILKLINNIRPDIVNNMLYNISTRIFGTEWFIRRNTIGLYNMKYSIKNVDILSDINQDNFYKNYINIHERK